MVIPLAIIKVSELIKINTKNRLILYARLVTSLIMSKNKLITSLSKI